MSSKHFNNLSWNRLASSRNATSSSLGVLCRLVGRGHDDCRRNEVDEVGNLVRERVLIGTNVGVSSLDMVVHVVLGLENRLELSNSRLEVNPALALGSGDLVGRNTRLDQPVLDGVDRVLIRGEELNNLILGIVFAIVGRGRIRTVRALEIIV